MEVCGQSYTPAALQPGMSPGLDGHREEKITSLHAYGGTVGRRRKSSNLFTASALEGKGDCQDHAPTTLPLGKYRLPILGLGASLVNTENLVPTGI